MTMMFDIAVRHSAHSRLPVFIGDRDNIVGILYTKDYILAQKRNPEDFKWRKILRKPFIFPESKTIYSLFKSFRENRVHMGIVVNEYGTVSGIVAMDDILDELFGSNHRTKKALRFHKSSEDSYFFLPRITIENFNES